MRKIGDLMKELGFREGASDDVKRAFLENLMKTQTEAVRNEVPTPQKASERPGEQLSLFETEASPVGNGRTRTRHLKVSKV